MASNMSINQIGCINDTATYLPQTDCPATVPHIFKRSVQKYKNNPFIEIVGGVQETYGETWIRVLALANRLKSVGICPKDNVVLMLANSHLSVHAWLAINFLNAVDVSINTGYKGNTLEHALNIVNSKTIITTENYLPTIIKSVAYTPALEKIIVLDAQCQTTHQINCPATVIYLEDISLTDESELLNSSAEPWDIASIIFTSGTSGPAKAVQMPHTQASLLAYLSATKMGLNSSDIFFSFYPMYHMAGKFMSVLGTISVGGKLVMESGFKPDQWLDRIRDYGATVTAAHGPMLEMVYAQDPSHEDTNHKLRLIRTAPFPKRIAKDFEQRFGVRGMEVWGMTEVGVVCWSDPAEPLRVGSCGRPDHTWYEFSVVDPATDAPLPTGQIGEFVVRPKHPWSTTTGYAGMPEQTIGTWRNLWFHTGDCGYIDGDGFVYFVDRKNERIRRRAENISASDIEGAALEHPNIAEAAAIGVPSEFESDDDIMIFIVPKSGFTISNMEILQFLLERIPHFMIPRYILQQSSLPRTITGKLQRSALNGLIKHPDKWDRKAAGISLRVLAKLPND